MLGFDLDLTEACIEWGLKRQCWEEFCRLGCGDAAAPLYVSLQTVEGRVCVTQRVKSKTNTDSHRRA